jgi:hypothetical protein
MLVKPLPELVAVDTLKREGIANVRLWNAEILRNFVWLCTSRPSALDRPGENAAPLAHRTHSASALIRLDIPVPFTPFLRRA